MRSQAEGLSHSSSRNRTAMKMNSPDQTFEFDKLESSKEQLITHGNSTFKKLNKGVTDKTL